MYNTLNSVRKGVLKVLLKDLIAEYVTKHGISYRAFAKQIGVSCAYLSMINSGNNPSTGKPPVVSYQKLAKIASGMGMTTQQLINMVDDMPIDISEPPATDVLYISKPSGDMKADEVRKFLHETIDSLSDSDLEFFKDFTLRMKK